MDDHGMDWHLESSKLAAVDPEVHHPSERSFGCWWYDLSLEAPRRYGGFLAKLSWFGWESMFFSWGCKCSWWMEPGNFPSVVPRPRRFTLTFARWTPSCVAVWNWVRWRMRRQWVFRVGGLKRGGRWVGILEGILMWLKWPSRGRPFFLTRPMCSQRWRCQAFYERAKTSSWRFQPDAATYKSLDLQPLARGKVIRVDFQHAMLLGHFCTCWTHGKDSGTSLWSTISIESFDAIIELRPATRLLHPAGKSGFNGWRWLDSLGSTWFGWSLQS